MSQMPFTPCNPQVPATQTSSQGFVPIGLGNDSDAESLQQFPIKEHAPSVQKFISHNAEALSDNQTTPDTSRSGYVNLPRPAGGVGIPPQQSGIPQYTQQNGLFQLRPQVPQQPQDGPYASKVQTFDSFDAQRYLKDGSFLSSMQVDKCHTPLLYQKTSKSTNMKGVISSHRLLFQKKTLPRLLFRSLIYLMIIRWREAQISMTPCRPSQAL